MPVCIDPLVDCVVKRLLGNEQHPELLVDFLNAVRGPEYPRLRAVTFLGGARRRRRVADKDYVVDVLVVDEQDGRHIIEVQGWHQVYLRQRMLFSLSDRYQEQAREGLAYGALRSVSSVWLLGENLFREPDRALHTFTLWDHEQGLEFSRDLSLHVVELERWSAQPVKEGRRELQRWLRFFAEAATWTELPTELRDPIMETAMNILWEFRHNQGLRNEYRQREEYGRIERAREYATEQAAKVAQEARQRAEEAGQRAEEAGQRAEEAGQRAEMERQRAEVERSAKEQERAAKEQERAARLLAEERIAQLEAELRRRGPVSADR
jgi:predicted transposase/invertase (TIGR01784 family)